MLAALLGLAGHLPGAAADWSPEALQNLAQACPRWDDCAHAAEAKGLAATSRARREGATLWLTLPGGRLRFDDDVPAGLRHRYLGDLGNTGLALVAGLRAAQTHFWLVDPASTRMLEASALPWPSPDGRFIVVVTGAVAERGGSLTLYQRSGTRWTRQYSFEAPQRVGFSFRSWRMDSAAVRLAWDRPGVTASSPPCTGLTQLRDGPYGWDLVPELPAACP